jgi:hypothetical protein
MHHPLGIRSFGRYYTFSVPEPAFTLGLLSPGAFGVGFRLKGKQKQKTLS